MTKELDAKIKELASIYWNEFLETSVDAEWSQTAYEDLGELKSEMDWAEFHDALEYQVNEIVLWENLDEDGDEKEYYTYFGGVIL